MICCRYTVYPALDSLGIEGKYDQRMLLSAYAVVQTDPESSLVAQDVSLNPDIIGGTYN